MRADFSDADFFNNVAAVAVVLVFANIVSHRSHPIEPTRGNVIYWPLHILHSMAVFSGIAAAAVALEATADQSIDSITWAKWLIAVAGTILLFDVLATDFIDALTRPKPRLGSTSQASKAFRPTQPR